MIVNRKKSFFCIDFSKYRLITNLGILCLWSLKTHQQDKKCTVLCDWLLWYSCTNSGWIFWSWKSGKLCSWKSLKVLEFLVWNWLWTLYVTPLHHSHLHCELSVSVNIHMSPWLLIDSGCPHWVSYTDDPPFSRHQSPHRDVTQTLHCRQPSLSGCRFLHLEHSPPENVVIASTLQSFQYHLKTFLFRRSFPHIHLQLTFSSVPSSNDDYLGHSENHDWSIDWPGNAAHVCV